MVEEGMILVIHTHLSLFFGFFLTMIFFFNKTDALFYVLSGSSISGVLCKCGNLC